MAKIAEHMGTYPSLLTHYFKTKDEMIVELVDWTLKKLEDTIISRHAEPNNAEERLQFFMDTIFDPDWTTAVDGRAFYACYYVGLRNDRVRDRLKIMYDRLTKEVAATLELCIKEGSIGSVDPEKTAHFLMVLIEGLIFFETIINNDRKAKELRQSYRQIALRILKGESVVAMPALSS